VPVTFRGRVTTESDHRVAWVLLFRSGRGSCDSGGYSARKGAGSGRSSCYPDSPADWKIGTKHGVRAARSCVHRYNARFPLEER
jgi:hypothetical protein